MAKLLIKAGNPRTATLPFGSERRHFIDRRVIARNKTATDSGGTDCPKSQTNNYPPPQRYLRQSFKFHYR